ncbi:hypothetical protein PF008_g4176 [Phytophthora fragariae]|uniref:Uncharacterized protein n=1 Tax=Phytophthora fragariae TaxID=53985 RepID=A0A6G0SDY7_9STRA|nr:hypothetical protein PF008_g4176 [Phytophthora fragariae]
MAVSWTNDREKPGAPSSMDLLLRWLLKPGNYERWKTASRSKMALMREIVEDMERNGIQHRTPQNVYYQIHNLRRRFDPVKKWLEDEGKLASFRRGEEAESVATEVARRCPQFRELMPVFDQHKGTPSSGDEEQQEDNDEATHKIRVPTTDNANLETVGNKRKAFSRSCATSEPPMKKTETLKSQLTIDTAGSEKRTKVQEVHMRFGAYSASPPLWNNRRGDDFFGINYTPGEEVAQMVMEKGLKYQDDLANCHLSGEQKREELRTKTEKVMLRYKMKREGLSDEDIDAAVPM